MVWNGLHHGTEVVGGGWVGRLWGGRGVVVVCGAAGHAAGVGWWCGVAGYGPPSFNRHQCGSGLSHVKEEGSVQEVLSACPQHGAGKFDSRRAASPMAVARWQVRKQPARRTQRYRNEPGSAARARCVSAMYNRSILVATTIHDARRFVRSAESARVQETATAIVVMWRSRRASPPPYRRSRQKPDGAGRSVRATGELDKRHGGPPLQAVTSAVRVPAT